MDPNPLDVTFAALADPTRRAILARLASGEASVTELAEPFAMTQPAISKHLKVLERAGLISRGQDAQRRPRRLEAKPLAEATEWLENYRQFWEGRFQRLDALLDEMKTLDQKSGRLKSSDHLAAARLTRSKVKRKSPRNTGSLARIKVPIKRKGDRS
ncbi:MAG: metalloregulator ArsR/SmtB family transcription factor [Terriglobales bacterium]|jgi:DNA-binding transcriptional ArsR family regulator